MDTISLNKKELILSLIKDDLISSRLVSGLDKIGLEAKQYYLHLSETIFKLIGFKDSEHTDEVFQHYFQLAKKAESIDISNTPASLNELALEIYRELLMRKEAKE